MNILQEAKYSALNLMAKPFGMYTLPKDRIQTISDQYTVSSEQELWFFKELPDKIFGHPVHSRDVVVIDSKGKERRFKEMVEKSKAGSMVTIQMK